MLRQYLAIILKTFAIKFTLKILRCELSSSFDVMSDPEERDISFLPLAVMFKTKMKNEREKKFGYKNFFGNEKKKKDSTI